MTNANTQKCINCGKEAVCFWPTIDPDTESHPYCRKCVDEAKERVMEKIMEMSDDKS